MTHIQHHVSPTEFQALLDPESSPQNPYFSGTALSAHDFAERLRKIHYEKALEWTPDMDGKQIWTPDWDEQAWKQMHVNFMEVDYFNMAQHVLYLPLDIYKQISQAQWKAFEILLDRNHRPLSIWDRTIAPVLSDKEHMFLYRTSLGLSDYLEEAVEQIKRQLWKNVDMPNTLFFEWLHTDPNSIKPRIPWVTVEWYAKAHRVDKDWSFQNTITTSAWEVWSIIEWVHRDGTTLWDWIPDFRFQDASRYHHILPQ